LTAGELILEVSNRTPVKEAYQFASIQEGLHTSGVYVLQYEMQPSLPGQPPLASCTRLTVGTGQPVSFELQVIAPRSWLLQDTMLNVQQCNLLVDTAVMVARQHFRQGLISAST